MQFFITRVLYGFVTQCKGLYKLKKVQGVVMDLSEEVYLVFG